LSKWFFIVSISCNKYIDGIDLLLLSKVSEVCFSQIAEGRAGFFEIELSLEDFNGLECLDKHLRKALGRNLFFPNAVLTKCSFPAIIFPNSFSRKNKIGVRGQ